MPPNYTFDPHIDNSTLVLNSSGKISIATAFQYPGVDNATLDALGTGNTLEVKTGGVGTSQLASAAVTAAKMSGAIPAITAIGANFTLTGNLGVAGQVAVAKAKGASGTVSNAINYTLPNDSTEHLVQLVGMVKLRTMTSATWQPTLAFTDEQNGAQSVNGTSQNSTGVINAQTGINPNFAWCKANTAITYTMTTTGTVLYDYYVSLNVID